MKGGNGINIYLEIQMSIFMCILLTIILIHGFCKLNLKHKIDKLFIGMNALIVIQLVLEVLSVLCNKTGQIDSIVIHRVVNVVGFALTPLPTLLMWAFLNKWIYPDKKIGKKVVALLSIPFIIQVIYSLLSYRYNYIFQITDQNNYIRGPFFILQLLVSYFYFMMNMLYLWKHRNKIQKEELTIFGLAILLPLSLGLIQIKYFIYLTIWNSWAIAVICLYIFILNEKAKKDMITGLKNRTEYNHYLTKLRKIKNIKLAVINIDMDELKKINDTYGHSEGDEAIKVFGQLLGEVFIKNANLIRLGGDEFIVFIKDNDESKINMYIDEFKCRVDQFNKVGDKPYTINFSYGIGIYEPEQENIDELMKRCDKAMYLQKYSKYSEKKVKQLELL